MNIKKPLAIALIGAVLAGGVVGGVVGALTVSVGGNGLLAWVQENLLGQAPAVSPSRPGSGSDDESATVESVRRVSPAVVSVLITKEVGVAAPAEIFPFDQFFGLPFSIELPQSGSTEKEKRQIGGGTGFIIDPGGLIVTNRHVVEDKEAEYTVVLSDSRKFPAKVMAIDPLNDLGIIKIEATGLPTVELGESDSLRIGETVIAIGNTFSEFPNTVTKGVVSGLSRRIVAGDNSGNSEVIEEAIQTDAAINPGNSGGPLVDLAGRVVGVNVAVRGDAQGVGFAIPINTVKVAINSFRANGKIVRAWLGVRYYLLTPELARTNKLDLEEGALLVRGDRPDEPGVVPGSPAEKAGLLEGDVVLKMDGVTINKDHGLAQIIARHAPGDILEIIISRGGKEQTVGVALGEVPDEGVQ